MSNVRQLVFPPAQDTPTRVEQRPPIAQNGCSFIATQKGWPPYMPGYFGPFSLPPSKPSAILDLRDKRYGKEVRVGNPRFAERANPAPYHSLSFDSQTQGDWSAHFERFMPPGRMVRGRRPAQPLAETIFPERALGNRKNYGGYHFLPNYERRYVVGDKNAPWNKSGDFTYKTWASVVQQADYE